MTTNYIAQEYFPFGCNVLLIPSDPLTGEEDTSIAAGHNLVVTAGKVLTARMLQNDSDSKTGITFGEVGTSTTTPVVTDTNIGTVSKRNPITTTRRTSNRIQYRTFYAAADISAVLRATGLYGSSGASTSDQTGELFNHAKINFDNTAGTKDLTVVIEVTFG